MWRRGLVMLLAIGALLLLFLWRSSDRAQRSTDHGSPSPRVSEITFSPSPSKPDEPRTTADASLTHLDVQKRAEILRELLSLLRSDAATSSISSTGQLAATGQPQFRTTNDIETAARFIEDRIRNDFVPMAKGCYNDLLQRKPEAEGDVVVGFEILGDESVGGVVNSAEIREESTLRDPSLETCLRESFLAVYFDPPPARAQAAIRFPFHFAHGDVDSSHQLHLRDRRGETATPSQ